MSRIVASRDERTRGRSRSSLLVVALVGLAACRSVRTVPSGPARVPASVSSSAADCEALAREAARTLAPVSAMDSVHIPHALSSGCVESGAGMWWVEPGAPRFASDAEDTVANCPFRIVHVGTDGARVAIDPSELDPVAVDGELCASSGDAYQGLVLEIVGTHDFDVDGRAELILRSGTWIHEEFRRHRISLLTFDGVAVRIYPPAASIAIEDVVDVDADGIPDLVSDGPYTSWCPGALSDVPCGGPRIVFHALADGTFTDRDGIAIEALRTACVDVGDRFVVPDDLDTSLRAIHCARLRGTSEAAIRAAIEAAITDGAPEVEFRRRLLDAASVAPHLRIQ